MSPTYTDRSRIICYQTCNRKRLLEFHIQGIGIRKSSINIYTSTGSGVHRGVEYILEGKDIEEAVKLALIDYDLEVKGKVLELDENEVQLEVYNEQRSLVEALIRVYYLVIYPKIIEEYDILGVEQEIEYPLSICDNCHGKGVFEFPTIQATNICKICNGTGNNIILMSKPDAIFRSKESGSLVVYSLKSASQWNDTTAKQFKYDVQGISELVSTEYMYKEEVESIKMDFLLKGSRQFLKGIGKKVQNTFLVHPYMYDTGMSLEWSLKYTKAKGWQMVNVWEHITIKEWIEWLYANCYDDLVGTTDNNSRVIVSPFPYQRSLEDIENWIESARYQESLIQDNIDILRNFDNNTVLVGPRESNTNGYKALLNDYFPQNRRSCFEYGGFCSYVDICWNGIRTDSNEYEARKPHHITELIQLEKKEN